MSHGFPSPRLRAVFLALLLLGVCAAASERLDQTAVGRFGAGHKITPNTASQSLLAWNTVCDGTFFEVRTFDARGEAVSLGMCGLTAKPSKRIDTKVGDIAWTGLTCRMSYQGENVAIRESLLTPALWFSTAGKELRLFQPLPGRPAVKTGVVVVPTGKGARAVLGAYAGGANGKLVKPWFLAVVRSGDLEVPVVAVLERAPKAIDRLPDGSLMVRWAAKGNRLGLLPMNGSRPALPAKGEKFDARKLAKIADVLAERFLWIPKALQESYKITETGVAVTNRVTLESVKDEWGWFKRTKGYVPVPPVVAAAKEYGFPVTYNRKVVDLRYPTYTSSFCVAPNANEITFTLPKPDVYGTIVAPVADPALAEVYAPPVERTIREYSEYVVKTYAKKPNYVFPTSAIGEGRSMTAEYACYRLMTPEARKFYDDWADQAAKDRIFNRDKFYGYGKDMASPRRFLIDNYRLGGNDYMDAGWFGYNIVTMWERAHYADRWKDIRDNWDWIREIFYGWNWVYLDYAVGYAPLYVDAGNGGGAKGYTDNMAMLPALYSWARMADKMGDKATYADAVYMTAKDRLGRYTRMTVHDYARRCGYKTEAVYMVSDQGNGPDLSPADKYTPPNSSKWLKGPIVDFGEYKTGLWFLTGSFLEPPSVETIDMVLAGDMKRRVADTNAMIDRRYPRWWAAPSSSEMSNYLIFLRGVLFHDNPARLRYYFDYQDGLGSGIWGANAFHPYAFLGIALSQNVTLETKAGVRAALKSGGKWVPVRDEAEVGVLEGADWRRYLTVWNSGKDTSMRLILDDQKLGVPGLRELRTSAGKVTTVSKKGEVVVPVTTGFSVWELVGRRQTAGNVLVEAPEVVEVLNGQTAELVVSLASQSSSTETCRITSTALALSESAVTLKPGETKRVVATVRGPKECVAPYSVDYTVDLGKQKVKKSVQVLVLPSIVALIDLQGDSFRRSPEIGAARVFAGNRLKVPATVTLTWSYGKFGGTKELELSAESTKEWTIPFEGKIDSPTRQTLKATIHTDLFGTAERERRVTVLPAAGVIKEPTEIVLFSFEEGSEGWYMPSWADGNQMDDGKVYRPYSATGPSSKGPHALESPVRITAGRSSGAFFGTPIGADWRSFDTLMVDVYLPPDAPEGLEARYYLIGSDWQWREPDIAIPLKPGTWTTLTMPLKGAAGAKMWKVSEEKLIGILSRVLDTGVKITNIEPGFVGYRGKVRVDIFRVIGK